jgi:hypothetical protein
VGTKECMTIADLCGALVDGTLRAKRWRPEDEGDEGDEGDERKGYYVVSAPELWRWGRATPRPLSGEGRSLRREEPDARVAHHCAPSNHPDMAVAM